MTLKPWIIGLLMTSATSSYALTQKAMINLLNQPPKQSIHHLSHTTKQPALTWTNLHGPRSGGNIRIATIKSNPFIIFAFHPHAYGAIYKSTDGGQHWTSLSTPKNEAIYDLAVVDENHLLLAADNHVYSSDDQGEHWTLSTTKDSSCDHIFVLNPNLILLETNHSYTMSGVYRSVDGGKTWEPARLGLDDSMSFWGMGGRDNLLFMGAGGLFVSTNGGKLWTQPSEKWAHIMVWSVAVNSSHDVFVTTANNAYKTDPQGQTWQKISASITGRVYKIAVDNNDNLYALGEDYDKHQSSLYQSTDQGQHWKRLYTYSEINDFNVLDNGQIIMSTNEGLIQTNDHQQDANKLPFAFSSSETEQVFATDANHFFALDKILYKSDDAGKSWSIARKGERDIINATTFNQHIVELEWDKNGNDQHILSSSNQGQTWQPIYDNIYSENKSSCHKMVSQNSALIVACEKFALFTRDLIHWKKINETNDMFTNPYYFDGKFIYSANGNTIKRSQDEGQTWTILLDQLHGYGAHITGYQDIVLITIARTGIIKITNEGKDWDLINNGLTDFHFSDITAIDNLHYIVSTDDGIFYTTNGGNSWTAENSGLDNFDIASLFANKEMVLIGTKGSGVFYSSLQLA